MSGSVIPCVGAIVADGQGRLLMIKRGHEPGAGLWSIPGGRIEPGETDAEAVARVAARDKRSAARRTLASIRYGLRGSGQRNDKRARRRRRRPGSVLAERSPPGNRRFATLREERRSGRPGQQRPGRRRTRQRRAGKSVMRMRPEKVNFRVGRITRKKGHGMTLTLIRYRELPIR